MYLVDCRGPYSSLLGAQISSMISAGGIPGLISMVSIFCRSNRSKKLRDDWPTSSTMLQFSAM
jgi:hypothetical protein